MLSKSPSFKLDLTDFNKLGRDATVLGIGTALVYMLNNIGSVNLGENSAILVPLFSLAINAMYRYFRDNSNYDEVVEGKKSE